MNQQWDCETPARGAARHAWLPLLLALAGCGGGSGQAPDPIVEDFGIAYVRRPVTETDTSDARRGLTFNAGADLYYRDLASPSAPERNVTLRETTGLGDVKDVEVSYDGAKLLFAMRAPEIEGAAPEDQPTWNIWEYDIASDSLRRVIASDITAEAGQDVAPHYLPDGRILFASTRQRQSRAVLLDEGKPQFAALDEDRREEALVLHVMDADGGNIHQISFNQSHDLDPTVLAGGEVLFTRWDHMGGNSAMHLYKMYPDGSELQALYGVHSHASGTGGATVQFLQPREREDGRIMAILRPFTGLWQGGDLVLIDTQNYVDNLQPTWVNRGTLTGPAQVRATINDVRTDGAPSPGGRFSAAYPLWDGTDRALVSWSECRLVESTRIVPCTADRLAAPAPQEAPPLYGVFIYDLQQNTQLPIVAPQEGVMYTDVVAAQPRTLPPILFDKVSGMGLDADLVDENVGVLDIRSVYDFGTTTFTGCFLSDCTSAPNIATLADLADPLKANAAQRPARFLRIEKAVAIPGRDVLNLPGFAFGRSAQQLMREIVGYAPVEPDGSVKVKVPANVPLALSVLDADGRRIGVRHQNWMQVRAGETLACSGCHTHATGANPPQAHGRPDAEAPSINAGAPVTGQPFPNTVNTLWADFGESMAQTRTRLDRAALKPAVDLLYDDVWTDPALRTPDASLQYRYVDLTTPAPTGAACQTNWTAACRIVINYEQHIHPLWGKDRGVNTCTACHGDRDAAMAPQVPAAQLDLGDGPSTDEANHFKSYRELLFNDNEQELDMGALQDVLVQATDANGDPLFQTDANGNLILDGMGNPIPVLAPVTVTPPMSTAGARASARFFGVFAAGGTHAGRLDPAELRLIAEWLDIGAQYFNDPFQVPVN